MVFWVVIGVFNCVMIHQVIYLLWIQYWSVRIDREVFEPWNRALVRLKTLSLANVEGWEQLELEIQGYKARLAIYDALQDSMNPLVWYRALVERRGWRANKST